MITIYKGDVLEQLAAMADNSIDCCVTSPPYWGLRDYGVIGQMGMERTLGEHLEVMVRVFEQVRRVLKPTGTLWLNYGDCYATAPNGRSAADVKALGKDDRAFRDKPFSTIGPIHAPGKDPFSRDKGSRRGGGNNHAAGILKPKDLCMIPNRLAIALQEAGWWVRSEIIWAKPNPMPESIKDRPATSHEKIFLLSKSSKYYYDAEAVRQEAALNSISRWAQDIGSQTGSTRANGNTRTDRPMKAVRSREVPLRNEGNINHTTLNDYPRGEGRSLRNWEPPPMQVWEIATAAFRDAHFATFPPELVERCLLAGCPAGGLVLDPFGGAGTTAMVADQMGRESNIIELNEEYCRIAWQRIKRDGGMLTQIKTENFQMDMGL